MNEPPSQPPHDEAQDAARPSDDSAERGMDSVESLALEPMSASLLGRFFAVPLLIIGTIVGGAVVVVLLFGGPASPENRSIDTLLQVLEANSGERSLGVLLPREKELWQTALELSSILKKTAKAIPEKELESAARRLAAMVQVDMKNLDNLPTVGEELVDHRKIRSKRLEFLIHALGRTRHREAMETLVDLVRGGREPYVQVAMQELANLKDRPEAKQAIAPMVALLEASKTPETRLVACTALSVLAAPGDELVIRALNGVRLVEDGEVAWSASLALGRLGSSAGVSTLLDLMDRRFLESGDRRQVADEKGIIHRYPLSPDRVNEILRAAIDSASNLSDSVLWDQIEELKSDPSAPVRMRAIETLALHHSASQAPSTLKD